MDDPTFTILPTKFCNKKVKTHSQYIYKFNKDIPKGGLLLGVHARIRPYSAK